MIFCSNPAAQYRTHSEEIGAAIRRVLDSGKYILGPEVTAFESAFAAYCGVEHGIGVNSGTDALLLALRALGVGPGDEVITVAHTAVATVAAILDCGATPVLIDVEPQFYTMDPACLPAALTARTKAIIPVHLYGQCADMDAVMQFANECGVMVIEDCAQAAGARYHGCRVGSVGYAGCFSFYPTKNLGGVGDGGMVVTRDAAIAGRIRRLRQYGWDDHRTTEEPGSNSRLDELQAAILLVKLRYLDDENDRRRLLAEEYDQALPTKKVVTPAVRPGTNHAYHLYVVACNEDREEISKRLRERGIAPAVHYPVPVHLHRGYTSRCRLPAGGLPVTENLASRVLSLPLYPELTATQVAHVATALSA